MSFLGYLRPAACHKDDRFDASSLSCGTVELKTEWDRMDTGPKSRRQSSQLKGAKPLSGGGQSLKLSTKASAFKGVSLNVNWG